ncbi:MAG: serine/threonine protein kinase [Phycisphaerae bacterium]
MLEEDRQRIIREFVQKLTDLGEEGEQVNLIDMVFAAHPELPDDLRSQLSVLQGALTNSSTTRTQTGSSSSTDSPALIPGYHVLHELHRGGQAIVYQAVQQSTKRKVAIKILLDGKHASPAARRRFEREVELVAQLKHPNIISIFDSGRTDDGYDYCIMDYIRGVPLTQFARNNKLALEDRLKLLATVCDAVKYAHQKGVIHRDLKPSNILVDSEGVPQVLDFGLAKQLTDSTDSMLSLTGQVVGTLPYMSPEQTGRMNRGT